MSGISIIVLLKNANMIPLIKDNFEKLIWDDKELIIIDDNNDSSIASFAEVDDCLYLHMNNEDKEKYFQMIKETDKNPNKDNLKFSEITNILPDGFKRDYGCGFSDKDFIMHMNEDCIYNAKAIDRKMKYLAKTGAECIYCDTVLCYDIYGKELYKSKSDSKIYESTLFHTKSFWKRRGFNWSDYENEGRYFHYNNGIDKMMDYYYDTIQLLKLSNMNQYHPIRVNLENIKIDVPKFINSDIDEKIHPFEKIIRDIFNNGKIIGINSEYLKNVEIDGFDVKNIDEKWKQKKLAGMIGSDVDEYECLIFGSKDVAWSLFNELSFKIIILETIKNREQMEGIILTSKKHKYIKLRGIYINQDFLNTISMD